MFQKLQQSLLSYGRFTDEHFSLLAEALTVSNISKGDLLLKAGSICSGIYFVNQGSFRQYEISDEDMEVTLNFFTEGDWLLEHKSLTSQKPSLTNIEANENSEVFFLSLWHFHHLVKQSEMFFQIGRIFENVTDNQPYQSSRLSPEEKYELLLKKRPHLINKFPAKQIASYLSITPETLSRVRRKIIS